MFIRTGCLVLAMVSGVAAEEDFYKSLMALTTPSQRMSLALKEKLEGQQYDPVESLAGVKLGMTMSQVVKVWGKPNFIWMQPLNDITQLQMRYSHFEFRRDKLIGISIHSASLPGLKLKNGISFKSTLDDVKKTYPSAQVSEAAHILQSVAVELKDGYRMDFMFDRGGKMIAMRVKRED
jgi:hypothetical protein